MSKQPISDDDMIALLRGELDAESSKGLAEAIAADVSLSTRQEGWQKTISGIHASAPVRVEQFRRVQQSVSVELAQLHPEPRVSSSLSRERLWPSMFGAAGLAAAATVVWLGLPLLKAPAGDSAPVTQDQAVVRVAEPDSNGIGGGAVFASLAQAATEAESGSTIRIESSGNDGALAETLRISRTFRLEAGDGPVRIGVGIVQD